MVCNRREEIAAPHPLSTSDCVVLDHQGEQFVTSYHENAEMLTDPVKQESNSGFNEPTAKKYDNGLDICLTADGSQNLTEGTSKDSLVTNEVSTVALVDHQGYCLHPPAQQTSTSNEIDSLKVGNDIILCCHNDVQTEQTSSINIMHSLESSKVEGMAGADHHHQLNSHPATNNSLSCFPNSTKVLTSSSEESFRSLSVPNKSSLSQPPVTSANGLTTTPPTDCDGVSSPQSVTKSSSSETGKSRIEAKFECPCGFFSPDKVSNSMVQATPLTSYVYVWSG